mgnify:CR=1 FL=1
MQRFVGTVGAIVGIKKYVGIMIFFVNNPKNFVDIGKEFVDKASEFVGIKKICRYHYMIC